MKPKIKYERLSAAMVPQEVPVPEKITVLVDAAWEKRDALQVEAGQAVKSGEKLVPLETDDAYAIAVKGGSISEVAPFTGNFGRQYTSITIDTDDPAEAGGGLPELAQAPSRETVAGRLCFVPGGLPPALLAEDGTVETIVVLGTDEDLACVTRQYFVYNQTEAVKNGIEILRQVTGAKRIVLAVPAGLEAQARGADVEVLSIDEAYPAANPRMIAAQVLGKPLAAGTECEEAGIYFVSAETAASLEKAFETKRFPERKHFTVIKKNGDRELASAVLGTPVGKVLAAFSEPVNDGDRIVCGGPMTGTAVYSEDFPVTPETDAVMIQDARQLPPVVDRSCINCGECVRICPAKIPVNVLIRYLEAGEFSEAADRCDLLACLECGLCSFVCPAQIPIFQYIQLGKYEFARENAAEADNA